MDNSVACNEIIEEEILRVIDIQVEDKKSVLEYTNPQLFEEEDVGFWREILHINYDVIEITEEIVSILFYFYTIISNFLLIIINLLAVVPLNNYYHHHYYPSDRIP